LVTHEQILELIRKKGPVIPSDINSDLQTNTMIIGAFLSDLVGSKKLKISNAKIGGSPLYYLDSQRPQLERLYVYLNEKDRRAYDDLKMAQVLFDDSLTPLVKTCLRQIKDFAIPLKVTFKEKEHLFWKFFLVSDENAKIKVKELLSKLYPEPKQAPPIVHIPAPKQESSKPSSSHPMQPAKKPLALDTKLVIEKPVQQILASLPDDSFVDEVHRFLDSVNIKIISAELVKKRSECNLFVLVPSNIGDLQYFCKARNKKKSSEGDIAAAFVEGQLRGLPVLYVSPGDIPKKLESMLDKKYKNLRVLKLWESR
jgi:hypothetical protein